MSLNTILKGRKVKTDLGYGKSVIRTISDIKENIHKFSNGVVVFKNYSVYFTNGDLKIYKSLDDINFVQPLFRTIISPFL